LENQTTSKFGFSTATVIAKPRRKLSGFSEVGRAEAIPLAEQDSKNIAMSRI
jgi:hypothetical protein